MQQITSQQVQTEFVKFAHLVAAQGSEPVLITQQNQPTMAVFSYATAMELMKLSAKMRFIQGLREDASYGYEPTDKELDDINRLIDEEREVLHQKGTNSE